MVKVENDDAKSIHVVETVLVPQETQIDGNIIKIQYLERENIEQR